MKTAIELIKEEMQRSEVLYGYSDEWIAEATEDYGKGELALAAASYLLSDQWLTKDDGYLPAIFFPWDIGIYFKPSPDERVKELVKAASMICREITRLKNIK